MKATIAAIGRQKTGAERELAEGYLERASAAGRRLGMTFALRELAESRAVAAVARRDQEAATFLAALTPGAFLIALDERGTSLTSRDFAEKIRALRESGTAELTFAIGGPDGHGDALLAQSRLVLAFGPMTWPHQLVRTMLCEQLYRAVTILSSHPYHRD